MESEREIISDKDNVLIGEYKGRNVYLKMNPMMG